MKQSKFYYKYLTLLISIVFVSLVFAVPLVNQYEPAGNITTSNNSINIFANITIPEGGGSPSSSYNQEPIDICSLVYDFIIEHYNGTLNYLTYEFEDLRKETNLTISELKDYLINYEDKCSQILPFTDYNPQIKDNPGDILNKDLRTLSQKIADFIKSIFTNTKTFLIFAGIMILIFISVKMIQGEKKNVREHW